MVYLALDGFDDDRAINAFKQAWPTIEHASGLIVDVRDNGGGSDGPGLQILSYLTPKPVPTAHATSRIYASADHAAGSKGIHWNPVPGTDGPFSAAHDTHFHGPVAVLIGPQTFSAAEDFVMSFKAMQRGVLVGSFTGGSTGHPLHFDLPGGGSGRVCAKRDTFPDGSAFVGKGIALDVSVALTVADVRAGRDPVLAAALAALKKPRS